MIDADVAATREAVVAGRTSLGIELGSTRIKAVLIGPDHAPIAQGGHAWENQFVDRLWTYSLDAVHAGVQECYRALALDVQERYGTQLSTVGALGISAMMHGYLAFDSENELLTPFRTWRNTNTEAAAARLSSELGVNIPLRWSGAHLMQAVMDSEEHVGRIAHLTTLAGYVHHRLTGRWVLGVGDASGMFPIDATTHTYHAGMVAAFDELLHAHGADLRLTDLLPEVLVAGQQAGELTPAGARFLDPTGALRAGAAMCPPEGDAGTGMVATNAVAPRTGNVSAGTSIFAMVVLERDLQKAHRELDLVTTPAGDPVAMVHCNNGASELAAWAGLFAEFADRLGVDTSRSEIFDVLVRSALDGAPDCGGLMFYNYLSGEHITEFDEGRPLFFRSPDSAFTLANFMRTQVSASLATLRVGMDVLLKDEGVRLDAMFAHGGLFTTREVGQRLMAAALGAPVTVGAIASEGGAWGIAVLAAYLVAGEPDQTLADFLGSQVFARAQLETVEPRPEDVAGFDVFAKNFVTGLPVERAAIEHS